MIKVKNLTKKFNQLVAVNNVSLEVEQGDIYGIIGYSGAGKSTLIRCLNLLEEYDQGEVIVDGDELKSLSKSALLKKRENIGMIFQHFNLLESQNVYNNIATVLKHTKGYPKHKIKEKVMELLKIVDLEDKVKAYPSQLSGGQKQRVAIARALSRDPSILLCDEATSALDPNTTKSILQLIKKINKELNVTVVLITHQMEVVKSICNKVAVMENGEFIEKGNVVDIFANPKHDTTKQFVSESLNESVKQIKQYHQEIYQITFIDELVDQPIISLIQQQFDIQINILLGNIEVINEQKIGSLFVEIIGREKEQAIQALIEKGTKVIKL